MSSPKNSAESSSLALVHESPRHVLDSPLILSLLRDLEVYADLTPEDFHEMAKLTERTNVLGLPVHAIERPIEAEGAREFSGGSIPSDLFRDLRRLVSREPLLRIDGLLAGGSRSPCRISTFVPQSAAHLAHGLAELLWPIPPEFPAPFHPDFYLIYWPESDDQTILHLPEQRLGLAIGTDDLRAGLIMAIEAAHRRWSAPMEAREKPEAHLIELLPGGSFPLRKAAQHAEGTLIFSGDSIPDEWEKWLVQKVEELAGCDSAECLLAGAEPWVAEGKCEGRGASISPFWRNPPLPAPLLAGSAAWTSAAIHPEALPFGVHVTPRGEVDLSQSLVENENAFIIVPRAALHSPFPQAAAPTSIQKLLTHKHVKNDAMKLWAKGFPTPEII